MFPVLSPPSLAQAIVSFGEKWSRQIEHSGLWLWNCDSFLQIELVSLTLIASVILGAFEVGETGGDDDLDLEFSFLTYSESAMEWELVEGIAPQIGPDPPNSAQSNHMFSEQPSSKAFPRDIARSRDSSLTLSSLEIERKNKFFFTSWDLSGVVANGGVLPLLKGEGASVMMEFSTVRLSSLARVSPLSLPSIRIRSRLSRALIRYNM